MEDASEAAAPAAESADTPAVTPAAAAADAFEATYTVWGAETPGVGIVACLRTLTALLRLRIGQLGPCIN